MNYFENKTIFKNEFEKRLYNLFQTNIFGASYDEMYNVLANMTKEIITKNEISTKKLIVKKSLKKTIYFSMEFLIGRLITSNLYNLGYFDLVKAFFLENSINIYDVLACENDAGLGNGGLGRLGACFLDSAASLALPMYGNSLRYRHGYFTQIIKNERQIEMPDTWLDKDFIWETRKENESVEIPLYGTIINANYQGQTWVRAVPYDIGIVGCENEICNVLRIWRAEKSSYYSEVNDQYLRDVRQITDVLYPDDSTDYGKYLRLKQQYFFSSAGVISAIREHLKLGRDISEFDKYFSFQINDTHPALVIPEMMRILMDEEGLSYEEAWRITVNTCSFTNHTILQEALEKWSIVLVKTLLPRIFEILEEINKRFLVFITSTNMFAEDKIYQMRVVGSSQVRMANLCIIGSHSVNGVAKLHTSILMNQEMHDFFLLYPNKFNNKTNGITQRRWLFQSNPALCSVLDKYIGLEYRKDFSKIESIENFKNNRSLLFDLQQVKKHAKNILTRKIKTDLGIVINPDSIFDIQIKRLHEYKRQILNILHIVYLYLRLKKDPIFRQNYYPHTFIFGAKAAPSYYIAKKTIQLICTVAKLINDDKEVDQLLKVVFIPNYNVSYAEFLIPAADVSEQISTASKEASGTGNMKFMMNGALTIGTLDGANVEIAELVGFQNIFIFGLSSQEVTNIYKNGNYFPYDLYQNDKVLHEVIDFINTLGPGQEFHDLRNQLLNRDTYLVLKDFHAYAKTHEIINEEFKDRTSWYKKVIANIAKCAFFSSDRAIREYNRDIWKLKEIK